MSVVGVDLGTLNTVIAVARNRGVDVVSIRSTAFYGFFFDRTESRLTAVFQITNEVSNRATP